MAQQRSGINRALMWLRKTLQVTELTDAPQVLSELLRPTIDVFGWDRYSKKFSALVVGGVTIDRAISIPVPDGEVHLITAASVESDEAPAVAATMWIEHRAINPAVGAGVVDSAVGRPFLKAAGLAIAVGLERPILLIPGESVIGRIDPAPAATFRINVSLQGIILDVGEYVPPL
jgi:hypothetical protein